MTRPIVVRELRSGWRTAFSAARRAAGARAERAADQAQHGRHDDVGAEHDAREREDAADQADEHAERLTSGPRPRRGRAARPRRRTARARCTLRARWRAELLAVLLVRAADRLDRRARASTRREPTQDASQVVSDDGDDGQHDHRIQVVVVGRGHEVRAPRATRLEPDAATAVPTTTPTTAPTSPTSSPSLRDPARAAHGRSTR